MLNKWFKENINMLPKIDLIEPHGEIRPDIMENWLNSILEDAQMLIVPGVVLSKGNSEILERYGIDRIVPGVVLSKGNSEILERYGIDRKSLNDVG